MLEAIRKIDVKWQLLHNKPIKRNLLGTLFHHGNMDAKCFTLLGCVVSKKV